MTRAATATDSSPASTAAATVGNTVRRRANGDFGAGEAGLLRASHVPVDGASVRVCSLRASTSATRVRTSDRSRSSSADQRRRVGQGLRAGQVGGGLGEQGVDGGGERLDRR
jgi:hypothetical protein